MKTIDAMLESHVQYELKRLSRQHLKRTVKEEVGAVWDWLGEVRINAVLSEAQVLDAVRRNAIDMPISDEMRAYIRENVALVYDALRRDATPVEDILTREVFDDMVTIIIGLEDLRGEITHQIVSSSVYARLISNVLYHGIKNFLLTENVLARNIPGASSLVRLGKRSLNAASPKLEGGIDRQLIKFVNANIQDTIAESETFLNTALDPALMRKLGDEAWETNATTAVGDLAVYVDVDSLSAIVDVVEKFWLHYRETPLFTNLVAEVVRHFFARYGEQDARSFLESVGITQDVLLREASALITPWLEHARDSGYAERRLRARLGAFYAQYDVKEAGAS